MDVDALYIQSIPALVWGKASQKVYLYIHGQEGCKEEARLFASLAIRRGWQVLSVDLPEHGERKGESDSFYPWKIVPELVSVMEYAKHRWNKIGLFASSIGAWFSMLSFKQEHLEPGMFVSPVVDIKQLIETMMDWAGVSPERLRREQVIAASFGQTLSWQYREYAEENRISQWQTPTCVLYAGKDNLVGREIVQAFAQKFNAVLTIWEEGEHWFHTEAQLDVLRRWIEQHL